MKLQAIRKLEDQAICVQVSSSHSLTPVHQHVIPTQGAGHPVLHLLAKVRKCMEQDDHQLHHDILIIAAFFGIHTLVAAGVSRSCFLPPSVAPCLRQKTIMASAVLDQLPSISYGLFVPGAIRLDGRTELLVAPEQGMPRSSRLIGEVTVRALPSDAVEHLSELPDLRLRVLNPLLVARKNPGIDGCRGCLTHSHQSRMRERRAGR